MKKFKAKDQTKTYSVRHDKSTTCSFRKAAKSQ
uniref:Uncharacterized protein n=1 Tax=Rhizophora mucronata TaxID=61149 RepID=A0A2P2PM31_RHIMU